LHSQIAHLRARIVKTARKRRGHEECRKCKSIHLKSPTIKHHKHLAVANFDRNYRKVVQAFSKLSAGKDMIQMAVLSFQPKLNRSKLASAHRSLILFFRRLQFAI
jgi:hypothetical protein